MKKLYSAAPYGIFTVDTERQIKMSQLFDRNEYPNRDEFETIKGYIDTSSVVLDIGAHVGTLTVPIAKIAKEVLAFEPVKENLELLEENIRINNITNVKVFSAALGSHEGKVALEAQDAKDAGTYTITGGGDIHLITLDSISCKPSFIKMDVEGYEIEVLKGARKTLEESRPVIFFEINTIETRKRGDWWLSNVSDELKSLGYDLYLPTPKGNKRISSVAWTMFKLAPRAFITGGMHFSVNFLAVPESVIIA